MRQLSDRPEFLRVPSDGHVRRRRSRARRFRRLGLLGCRRVGHPWLLSLLPIAGLVIAFSGHTGIYGSPGDRGPGGRPSARTPDAERDTPGSEPICRVVEGLARELVRRRDKILRHFGRDETAFA